jgi:maltooligosyltrehalose synthase
VDYQRRQEILSLVDAKARGSEETIRELLANWRDGSIKLLVASELLKLRRRLPRLFQEGAYLPISNVGGDGDIEKICVFSRTFQEEAIVVAVSLSSLPLKPGSGPAAISKISLPEAPGGRRWLNLFAGRYFEGEVAGQEPFTSLPFAVLLAR